MSEKDQGKRLTPEELEGIAGGVAATNMQAPSLAGTDFSFIMGIVNDAIGGQEGQSTAGQYPSHQNTQQPDPPATDNPNGIITQPVVINPGSLLNFVSPSPADKPLNGGQTLQVVDSTAKETQSGQGKDGVNIHNPEAADLTNQLYSYKMKTGNFSKINLNPSPIKEGSGVITTPYRVT